MTSFQQNTPKRGYQIIIIIFSVIALAAASAGLAAASGTNAGENYPASYAAFSQSLGFSVSALQAPEPPDPAGAARRGNKAGESGAPAFPLAFARSAGKITVGINPNRELLYTILHLTEFSDKLRKGSMPPLAAAALNDLQRFKKHPAVAELDNGGKLNWNKGLHYDAFSTFPGYFSALPEGRRLYDYDDDFLERVLYGMSKDEKIKYLDAYWEKVMDFYEAAGYENFFKKNAGLYRSYVDAVYEHLPAVDAPKLHEDYHGNSGNENFYIIPSPLNLPSGGSYGGRLGRSIFNFMGYGFDDAAAIKFLILHEFGHAFCGPVVERYAPELGKYGFLMQGLKEEMGQQAYSNWITVMHELLVRSVHARLVLKTEGKDAADLFLLKEIRQHKFVFIKDFYDKLEIYEMNRDKYPTLHEFYPQLSSVFSRWEVSEVLEPLDTGIWATPGAEGLFIDWVEQEEYGYAAGFREGDTVTAVDGKKPPASFFLSLESGKTYTVSITRKDGGTESIILQTLSRKTLRPVHKPV